MVSIRANIQCEEAADRRARPRRMLNLAADASSANGERTVTIFDISQGGMLIDSDQDLAVGNTLSVALPDAGGVAARIVWRHGSLAGCEFEQPISLAALSAAILRADPEPPGPHRYHKEIAQALEEVGQWRPVGTAATVSIFGGLAAVSAATFAGLYWFI